MMRIILIFLFTLFSVNLFPQFFPQSAYIETSALLSFGTKSPFWLYSNKFGQYPDNNRSLNLKTGFWKHQDSTKKWDFSYSFDIVGNTNNQLYFHQAYIQFSHRKLFQFHIGKKEEFFGDQDKDLSSGNLLWSGNARPVPAISFSTPGYITILKGLIDIKGYIAHGWMNDNRYIKNYYLHHKNAYIQLGSKFPVTFSYGLEHFAQWGGYSPEYGQMPDKLKDFTKVFFAKSGDNDAPWVDTLNRLGNHLGSKNFTLEIKTKPIKAILYWQYIFEDASRDRWENISDGLWGISIELKNHRIVNKLVFEYINTTNQSGPIHLWNDTIQLGGSDDYFNNVVYRNGWKYYDRIIGTPFITPETKIKEIGTKNNCIKAFHAGMSGILYNNINYKILVSYVKNYGTIIPNFDNHIYSTNPPEKKILLFFETKYPLIHQFELNISASFDIGKNDLLGYYFSLRKNIELNRK